MIVFRRRTTNNKTPSKLPSLYYTCSFLLFEKMKAFRCISVARCTIAQRQSHQFYSFSSITTKPPSVSIAPDGLSLQLSFSSSQQSTTSNNTATISAPWLFHQHPRYIHASSGQHLRPLVEAHQYKLRRAQIVQRRHDLHPVAPPAGCFHSVGTVYSNFNDSTEHKLTHPLSSSPSEWILRVDWEGPQTPDTAFYDIQWLRQCHVTNGNALDDFSNHTTAFLNHQTQLDTFSYHNTLQHDDSLYQLLKSLLEYGAVLVDDTPDTDTACANIGKRIGGGNLSHGSLYGDVFHVQSIPNAHNIAYTNDALPVHQDLSYYESPPGFQLLHCRANAVADNGGASLLIDAVAAARAFADLAPELFEILTRLPATFLKQRSGADMMYRRTHIRVSGDAEVLSVHWAPPFEGPFFASSSSSSLQDTRDYFMARAAFERMLDVLLPRQERYLPMLNVDLEKQLAAYAHTYTWQQTLRPQQILVFSNQRLLHGRTAFSVDTGGTRHLTGCYTNVDETLQQYRLLRRQRLPTGEADFRALPIMGHGNHRIL